MIKMYGSRQSSSRRCYWMLEEAGVAYEEVPMSFQNGDFRKPEFLALNPNGKVPTMVDGDFVLWESLAINTYLAEKYKPSMLGATLEDKAHVSQWSFWAIANLAEPLEVLVIQKLRSTPDDALTAHAREVLPRFLAVLDGVLANNEYLVANQFTLADLNVLGVLGAAHYVQYDLSSYANIMRWAAMLSARDAFQKVQTAA